MELVIAEKPSVAQALAKVIGANERCDGYLKGNGYIVSWCVGHLVELAQPDAYDDKFKHWNYESLPIMPDDWKYVLKKETKAQFKVLKDLMMDGDVDALVCATDAGREGELIFRLVVNQAKCRKPIKRLWISSMEESAIREGFKMLKPGSEYENLYQSALCRQKADWLVGMNGTRLFTVLYRGKVLKVGRVQTPTLAMLVERQVAINNFKKTPFYTVHLTSGTLDAVSEKYLDREKAQSIADACDGLSAKVQTVISEEKSIGSPRLYDLTSLQRDANRIFSFTAKQTLEFTQSLYEKKLCTYPRTDSQYLSDDMAHTANQVLKAIGTSFSFLPSFDSEIPVDKILNSAKVTDHHAIIPTVEVAKEELGSLPEGERKVLSLLATRLVTATADKYLYRSVKAEIVSGGYVYIATGKTVISEGFKKYEADLRNAFKVQNDKEDSEEEKSLPELEEGMEFSDVAFKVVEGFTKPPQPYTEDSLLSAMERAGASEMGDDVERKGLGTPATRADIIEKLVKDGFVRREKKKMLPTEDGMKLITVLPDVVKSPQLTADWENALILVSKGEMSSEAFMDGIKTMVKDLISTYSSVSEEDKAMFEGETEVLGKCPKCGADVTEGKFGVYCTGRCGMTLGKALGKELTADQAKNLMEGKKTLVKGIKSKKGGTYDAYLTPDGISEYSFTTKDGEERTGFQYKFKMDFPERKKGD